MLGCEPLSVERGAALLALVLRSMEGSESPGAETDLPRLMDGVANLTSPSAGFFGSSTGGAFRGLKAGLGAGVKIEFVLRGAGATGVLFAEEEGTATGGTTGDVAGEELTAATEASECVMGLEMEGVGSAAGEPAGWEALELPPSNPEMAFPGWREYQTPPATSNSEAAMPTKSPVLEPEAAGSVDCEASPRS